MPRTESARNGMKLIVASIRPDRLEAVQASLDEPGVSLLSVIQAIDPRAPGQRESYRGLEVRLPQPRLRVEIVVVNEALVERTVDAVARAAAAGPGSRERTSDGDILVVPLERYQPIHDRAPEAGSNVLCD